MYCGTLSLDLTAAGAKPSVTCFHLAQVNIGRFRAPIEDPIMEGFRSQLDPVNALADRSPGFVWRPDEDGNATAIRPYTDERMAINMSVWESLEALQQFVYRTAAHVGPLRDRKQWFEPIEGSILALWWIPAGHIPTVDEAKARLEQLRERGPSPDAFTFRTPFPPPDARSGDIPVVDAIFCEWAT